MRARILSELGSTDSLEMSLFQGLSYHDTPEGPPPEMRYLDVSAKPGEKQTYSILTVNSAGVPSEPSAQAAIP